MPEEQKKEDVRFSDYLSILLKWKKFIIINSIIIIIIALVISFLIPKTYRAETTLMLPQNQDLLGGSQLSGLLSAATPFLGSKLIGNSGQSIDQMFGILNSRRMLINVINKFHLLNYYKINNHNYDKALKAFRGDVQFDLNENSMIVVSVENENPDTSAMIANYFVKLLDSLNTKFNIQEAKNNREFIQMRYDKNITDLQNAEDSLKKFQQKYGIYAVPQQIESAIKIVGEMESQLEQKELEAHLIENSVGKNSPLYQSYVSEINIIKNRLSELKSSNKLTFNSIVLFPFKKIPEMQEKYLDLFREVTIQSKIMEFILPLFEKAKIDEQKSIPTVIVLDKAVPPQIKYRPKKSLIVLGITFPFFLIFLFMVFQGEKTYKLIRYRNIVEEKEANFYRKIIRFYKLNIS